MALPSWIRKVGNKTVTRTLSAAQAERYRPLFDNTKRLRVLVAEIEAVWPVPSNRLKVGHNAERRASSTSVT